MIGKSCICGSTKIWKAKTRSHGPFCKTCWAKYQVDTSNPINRAKPIQRVSANKLAKIIEDAAEKARLAIWFAEQIAIMPRHCENCDEILNPYAPWRAKAYIAHILEKSKFKTVSTAPENRLFLCVNCHGNWDRLPDRRTGMRCYLLALQRATTFIHLVPDTQINRAHEYLRLSE